MQEIILKESHNFVRDTAVANKYRSAYMVWLFLSVFISFMIYQTGGVSDWKLATKTAVFWGCFIAIAHFLYMQTKRPVNYLAPDLIFLAAYCLFHFGYLFFWAIGIFPESEDIFYNTALYPKTVLIVNWGMAAFLFGYELSAPKYLPELQKTPPEAGTGWGITGLILMATSLFITFVYLELAGIGNVIARGSNVLAEMDKYVSNTLLWTLKSQIFAMGFGIYIIAVATKYGKLFKGKLGISLFVVYFFLLIVQGGRTQVVIIGMVLLLVRHYLIKPVTLKWLILLAVIFAFVFSVMGATRGRAALDITKITAEYKYADTHWYDIFIETGGSVSTINKTISIIPSEEGYWHGKSYASAIVHIIPFVQGYFFPTTQGAAQWLTYTTKGFGAAGTGFSIAGEGYLNFGLIGVLVQMLLIGAFLRRIVVWYAKDLSPSKALVFLISVGIFITIVRNNVNTLFAPIFQIWLLSVLIKFFLGEVSVGQDYNVDTENENYN
jgi:oligosaccharide repeat unit polymerase